MNRWKPLLLSVGFLLIGAAIVIFADRMGWVRPQSNAHDHTDPHAANDHGNHATQHDASPVPVGSQPAIVLTSNDDLPRSQRPPSPTCTTERTLVQFADAQTAQRAGLGVVAAQEREVTQALTCNAELAFNGDRFAHISPRAVGVVQKVERRLGDVVETGDVLAVIDSAELGSAKAELLQAITAQNLWQQHYDRQRSLTESGVTAQRDLLDAESRLAETSIAVSRAAQRLRNLGVSDQGIDQIRQTGDTGSMLVIAAPFSGVVIDQHAVLGEVVDPEHTIYSIADTSIMWAMLDVYESDARQIKTGQSVTLQLSGLAGEPVFGTIAWISPQIDPTTRTLKVRAEVPNGDGRLRAFMFGRATIMVRDRQPMLLVPKQSVQWEGCCNVVFVKRSETRFQPRKVRLGHETEGWCAIEEGLEPGEMVVTQGSYLLKTEILKGNIGAGCCADH